MDNYNEVRGRKETSKMRAKLEEAKARIVASKTERAKKPNG
tara:strand:- start:265 stop:387 length:123 start_codon:yes stop_codon:yes gene_type:complete